MIQPPPQIMQIIRPVHPLPLPFHRPNPQPLHHRLLRHRRAHHQRHPFLARILKPRIRHLQAQRVPPAALGRAHKAAAAVGITAEVAEAAGLVGEGPRQADEVAVAVGGGFRGCGGGALRGGDAPEAGLVAGGDCGLEGALGIAVDG